MQKVFWSMGIWWSEAKGALMSTANIKHDMKAYAHIWFLVEPNCWDFIVYIKFGCNTWAAFKDEHEKDTFLIYMNICQCFCALSHDPVVSVMPFINDILTVVCQLESINHKPMKNEITNKVLTPETWHNWWPHLIHNRSSKIIKIGSLIHTYKRCNYIIKIPSQIWLTHIFSWQILSLIVQQRLIIGKQLACMTDQVTDTKSGIQSGLFPDSVQIALPVYNLTIGQMCRSGAHRPGLDSLKGLSYCQILNW